MTELILSCEPGAGARQARLTRIISASQSFLCLSEEPPDQGRRLDRFNTALLALEDAKGQLKVLWRTEQDMIEFRALIDLAWRFQLEANPPLHTVTHEIMA